MAAQGCPQGLPAHPVPQLTQLDLEPAGAIATVMVIKHVDHRCFPSGLSLRHSALAPSVIAAGHDVQDLAKQLDRMVKALLVNKLQLTHGVRVAEKVAMAFFKISSSWACRRTCARKARTSAASCGSAGKGC